MLQREVSRALPEVQLMTFLVPDHADAWPERMEAACRVFERRLGVSLRRAHSGTKRNVTMRHVDDRAKYFRQRARTQNRWFSLSTEESRATLQYLNFGGKMYGGGHLFSAMCAVQPPAVFDESLIVELGDAMRAYSAAYLPNRADERIRLAHRCIVFGNRAQRLKLADRTPEEAALPLICESLYTGLATLQPHHLGWINYWSQEVCEYVGFPRNIEGSPILQHCYRTPGGAWIVKLGPEPFEPGNVAHLALLREMYERFPRVAVRPDAGVQVTEG